MFTVKTNNVSHMFLSATHENISAVPATSHLVAHLALRYTKYCQLVLRRSVGLPQVHRVRDSELGKS